MYEQSAMVRGRGAVHISGRRRSRGQNRGVYRQERIRVIQLVICLVLFLTAYIGKGVFPGRLIQMRQQVLTLISDDFDFRKVLTGLGESLAGEGTVLEELGSFCVQVFGAEQLPLPEEETAGLLPPQPASLLTEELEFLSRSPTGPLRTEHYVDSARLGLVPDPVPEEPERAEDPVNTSEAAVPEGAQAVPAAGTVVLYSDYSGQPLPANYTMDQLSLGDLETMTPLQGNLNSAYGYRDHPIDGRYQFHGGVDIGGQMGDPVAAFAAGTVEYIGEDDSYGLYLQIDHGNGVKSFYAHCSRLNVSKGQQVEMGETVALVGSSGAATGPHLHLELKFGKMHLNPAYYVNFLEEG